MKKLTLIQGDCLKALKDIPDESVDLVLTDPPYFNQGTKPKYSRKGKTDVITDMGEWDKFESDEVYLDWMKLIISEICRVLKDNGSIWVFTNDRYVSYLRHFIKEQEGMTYACTLVWHKYNSPPRFIMKATLISSKEFIMFAYKGKNPVFNKPKKFKDMLDVWVTTQTPSGERLGHPTQKPCSLIERIIKISSKENDIILDPFLGSGTTMKVARDLRRSCVGVEINPEYINMTKKRMNWGSSLGDVQFEFKVVD